MKHLILSVLFVATNAFAAVEINVVEGDSFNVILTSVRNLSGEAFLVSCGRASDKIKAFALGKGRNLMQIQFVEGESEGTFSLIDSSTGVEQAMTITCKKK